MAICAYIGIGANLGDARGNVEYAIAALKGLARTKFMQSSSLYITTPIDSSGDDYINAVVALTTELSPQALLAQLQDLELKCGRERPYRNAPRTLDLDLLLYGQETINTEHLTVPHPRMHERAFVLAPLLQIAPSIYIPSKGVAQQFLASVADQGIQKLD